jgi:hypothetical protein
MGRDNGSMDGSSDSEGAEMVIKLRGLPWAASKEDVLDFFSGKIVHNYC